MEPPAPERGEESGRAVAAAIAGNIAVATAKFVAAAVTGSSAILSEAIHSVVDTGDGILLAIGRRRSKRPPDRAHPFGHGKELYFWTTVVSILVFAVGGGMSAYEGILHLLSPHPPRELAWMLGVLGVSAVFEGAVWIVALREFRAARRGRSAWETIEATKDPLIFTVLLEDSAALLGILVAAAGVLLAHATGRPQFDGGASIVIGLLLMTVAAVLARESRGLLVGEATDPATEARIRDIAGRDPAVVRVGRLITVHFGPRTVVLNAELQFRPELRAGEVAVAVARIERRLKEQHPELKYLFLEGTSLTSSG